MTCFLYFGLVCDFLFFFNVYWISGCCGKDTSNSVFNFLHTPFSKLIQTKFLCFLKLLLESLIQLAVTIRSNWQDRRIQVLNIGI